MPHHISSFNESTGFGLLKASPVEFVKYPFVKVDLCYVHVMFPPREVEF